MTGVRQANRITGIINMGGQPAAGVEVLALDCNGARREVVDVTITDANGFYQFDFPDDRRILVIPRQEYGLPWVPLGQFRAGALVHGTIDQGYTFKALNTGTTGAFEPEWNTAGLTNDGSIQWLAIPFHRAKVHGPTTPEFIAHPDVMLMTVRVGDTANGPGGQPWGDGSRTFTLPLRQGFNYNFLIAWGDGAESQITAWDDPALSHTYALAGDYQIAIDGQCPAIYFNNSQSARALKSIDVWGNTSLESCEAMFYGCSNAIAQAPATINTAAVAVFANMFRNCGQMNPNVSGFDTGAGTNFSGMFYGCSQAQPAVKYWDMASATDCSFMFYRATSADPDLSGWEVGSLQSATNMLIDSGVTSSSYDLLLIGWAGQSPALQNGVDFDVGPVDYTETDARAVLTDTHGWDIEDGEDTSAPDSLLDTDFTVGPQNELYDAVDPFYGAGSVVNDVFTWGGRQWRFEAFYEAIMDTYPSYADNKAFYLMDLDGGPEVTDGELLIQIYRAGELVAAWALEFYSAELTVYSGETVGYEFVDLEQRWGQDILQPDKAPEHSVAYHLTIREISPPVS